MAFDANDASDDEFQEIVEKKKKALLPPAGELSSGADGALGPSEDEGNPDVNFQMRSRAGAPGPRLPETASVRV